MSSDLGTIFGSGGLVVSILTMIYAAINHKRIRAKICNRQFDFEINIDSTEEKGKEAKHSEKEESVDTKPKKKTAKVMPEIYPPTPIKVKSYNKERRWIEDDDADKELEEDEELGTGLGKEKRPAVGMK